MFIYLIKTGYLVIDRVENVIWTEFRNTRIAMTYGAYQLYVMNE
jgi:hypothetical protein